MDLVFLIYPDFTTLDLVGPLEVLSLLPDVEIKIAAARRGMVWPDNSALPVVAPYGIDEIDRADLLLVPGGTGTTATLTDARLTEWIARIDRTTRWTCSVCTGSLLLGAAGLLQGKPATTHWATMEALRSFGATPVAQRWVEAGKIVTAAGVSAGIDLALHLAAQIAGADTAKAIQLAIEYDPAPPFAAGSPAAAGPEIVAAVASGMTALTDRGGRSRPNLGWLAG